MQLAARKAMPDGIDVLFTHEPPDGVLDGSDGEVDARGCRGNSFLLEICQEKTPRVVLFGHVHYAGGCKERASIVYANCAIASDKGFKPKRFENPVHVFDIDPRPLDEEPSAAPGESCSTQP